MRTHLIISAVLAVAGAACGASSQAEQVRDARMEQIDDHTVAKTRIIESREKTRNENIDQHHELAAKQIEANGGADERAAIKTLDVSKERATSQSRAQARLETISVRIDAAKKKLDALGPTATVRLHDELLLLQKECSTLEQDIQALPETSAANWERIYEAVDDRLSDLNTRVKKLTRDIEAA